MPDFCQTKLPIWVYKPDFVRPIYELAVILQETMKNQGKQLEKTIRLIQETFKDSDNTKIYSNYKIPNESGNNREIDVLIVSKINDFQIMIAIECKGYSKKIPVEKIEAFQSKCERIKEINKKIFISSKGFQSDAINSANYFGIELLTAEEISIEIIRNLIPIWQLKPIISRTISNVVLNFNANETQLIEIKKTFTGEVFFEKNNTAQDIKIVIDDALEKYKKEIFGLVLIHWMKAKNKDDEDAIHQINIGLKFHDFFIKDVTGNFIELLESTFDIPVKFVYELPQISGRTLKDSKGNTKANSLDIKIKDNVESHMIIKPNNELDFYLTENKETRKLKSLFSYNPKTDKITKSK